LLDYEKLLVASNGRLREGGRALLKRALVDGDTQLLLEMAEYLGQVLAADGRASTSQLRDIVNALRSLNSRFRWDDVLLLKPKLHYRAARRASQGFGLLCAVLIEGIDMVAGDRRRFARLFELAKAVTAYAYALEGG
jgi:CRISPR type III-A-associated protein Csm2